MIFTLDRENLPNDERLYKTCFDWHASRKKPTKTLRFLLNYDRRLRHPELEEIYLESKRTEQVMKCEIWISSNCIDIGAHLGSMLSEILRLSPNGRHMAFEPTPQKACWLKQKFSGIRY